MAVKASATITLTSYRDTQSVTRYYKLQTAGSSTPDPPDPKEPSSDWTTAEPACDISKTLYFCDITVFSNGDRECSTVSKSSSYEAAKEAYNLANDAQSIANNTQSDIDNLEIGGRNYLATNKCKSLTNNGITFTPNGDGGILIGGTNNTPSGYGTGYVFPTGGFLESNYYSLFAGTYTLSLSGSEHYVNMLTDSSKFYYRLKRDTVYGTDIAYSWVGNAVIFTLTEDVEKVYIGFGFLTAAEIVDGVVYFKLEKGNKPTDWTPAPEDVDAGIADAKDEAQIAQNMTTTLDTEFSDFKENDYSQISDSVDDLINYKTDSEDKIAKIEEGLSNELVSKAYARIEPEKGSLILGRTNDTTAILNNEQFGFYIPNSDTPAAYFGKSEEDNVWAFNIERGIVKDDLRFGQFQWIARKNKNMSLKWL